MILDCRTHISVIIIIELQKTKTFKMFFIVLLLFVKVNAYNVDTFGSPSTFKGPERSYFGISMHVHRITGSAWLITGAPRANSTYQPALNQPGAIYMCSLDIVRELRLNQTDLNCTQVPLDRTGNTDPNEHKDFQWLGVSVHSRTVNRDHIMVACGHLWRYDGLFYDSNVNAVNGVCYVRTGHPSTFGNTSVIKEYQYAQYIRSNNDQILQRYGAGRLSGMASHVANDGRVFIGTPGVGRSTHEPGYGGITMFNSLNSAYCNLSGISYPAEVFRYLGFSITTGNVLCKSKYDYNLISGAPTWRFMGRVFIYEVRNCTGYTLYSINGTQLGSYYGASILAVDVNGDGWDDLFVGAPLYTTDIGDEGVVHVYYGSEQIKLIEGPLLTSGVPFGRFGTTISAAADLDQDGYKDIIIGAPYENDNQGAVYIYNGSPDGISSTYTQRIVASDLPGQPRGLGYGITGDFDVDRNDYEDIALGAYDSGHVYVIRTRPVLNIYMDTELGARCITPGENLCENLVGLNVPCYEFNLTVRWNSMKREALALRHVINWSVEMDKYEVDNHRAFFITDDQSFRRREGSVILRYTDQPHINFQMQVPRNPNDIIVPVKLNISYWLDAPNVTYKDNPSKLAPIVNHTLKGTFETEIQFCKECMGELTCETDLSVVLTSERPRYVIGQSEGFKLRIDITNDGDGAYSPELELRYPKGVEIENDVTCLPRTDPESSSITASCQLENPIPANTSQTLILSIKTSERDPTSRLTFDSTVKTASTETLEQLLNNNATLVIPIEHDARLQAEGSSTPESIVAIQLNDIELTNNSRSTQNVKHVLDIRNNGPGLFTNFTVDLNIPDVHRKDISVAALDFEISYDARREVDVTGCVTSGGDIIDSDSDIDFGHELDKLFGQTGKVTLDPQQVPFLQVQCAVNELQPGEGVIIAYTVEFLVSKKTEGIFSGRTEFDIISRIMLPKFIGELDCEQCQIVEIKTMIQPPASAGLAVPWWAILASVLGGLLLFVIIILVLAKLGFFRRRTREQLTNQRAKSMLMQAPEDEEDEEEEYPSATLENTNPQTPEEEKAAMQNYVQSALHN